MPTVQSTRASGFTLVEVIVVLVLLALLCAVVIPSFSGYIEKANEEKTIVETRECVIAAQSLMVENYGANKTILPEYDEIKALAKVQGTIANVVAKGLGAVLEHLTYENYGYTVTYCRDPAGCGLHSKVYTVASGSGVSVSGADSLKAVLSKFPTYNTRLDSLSIANGSSKVAALFNSLDDEQKRFLEGRSWCIYKDPQAILDANSSGKDRLYFTDKAYSATDSASHVTVYKARLNDDGTLSYQKGTCEIRNGIIYPNSGFSAWGDDWTKL